MGKRKITNFEKIPDRSLRNICYNKRMKSVIKKAMEVSLLCE